MSRCVLCYFCPVLDNPGTCRNCGDLFVQCLSPVSSVDSRLVCGTVFCVCVVSLFCLRPCAHGHFGPGEESTDSSHSLAKRAKPRQSICLFHFLSATPAMLATLVNVGGTGTKQLLTFERVTTHGGFSATGAGKYIPYTVFVVLGSTVVDEVRTGTFTPSS